MNSSHLAILLIQSNKGLYVTQNDSDFIGPRRDRNRRSGDYIHSFSRETRLHQPLRLSL